MYIYLFITTFLCSACKATISPSEMLEQGKLQYQLLQERVNLPKYGSCWRQAIEHIDRGCKSLTEETQSDVALHLANCFLEMSGHETYNCLLDKKPNLRGICINSMTDRAFNVYTEFYTHTQNICWFLQGQVWQEMISENTVKMGEVLRESTQNQQELLKNQKYSLELQERLSDYGIALEKILISTVKHQELLYELQSWIIGEVSWIDSIVFYFTFAIFMIFLTSSQRIKSARLPTTLLILFGIIFERLLSKYLSNYSDSVKADQSFYYQYVWYFRYFLIFITSVLVVIQIFSYKDYVVENNNLLKEMHTNLLKLNASLTKDEFNDSNEFIQNNSGFNKIIECNQFVENKRDFNRNMSNNQFIQNNSGLNQCIGNNSDYIELIKNDTNKFNVNNLIGTPSESVNNSFCSDLNVNIVENYSDFKESILNEKTGETSLGKNNMKSSTVYKNNVSLSRVNSSTNRKKLLPLLDVSDNGRYNLRSRQGTPDLNV